LSTSSLQQHLKMRRTSRNPAKATDRIADIPSGSRSSRPLQDPRLPPRRYHRWLVYAQTKLANLLFTFELDRRARAAGIPVTAVAAHPGLASTDLMASGQRGHPGGSILEATMSLLGQPVSQGALPLLMAATADLPGGTYVGPGGPGGVRGAPEIAGASRIARDPETARRLWELAEQATGVTYP
jgi:NAD(P)-dependent dehydrogenase (short-subunit alcohol dehydrogenase family)